MKKLFSLAALALAGVAMPAHAADSEGKLEIKVFGTAVLPDGKIDTVKSLDTATTLGAAVAATTGPQTKANDNYVPTVAIEYYFTPQVSVETICCFTQHHVDGDGGLAGTRLVDHVLILPATVTAKLHFDLGPVKPYVGAGPALFFVFGEKPGASATALGVTSVKMSDSFGAAVQAGFDVPLGSNGMGLSFDAKRYFMKPTAKFYEGSTLAMETKHKLDPWVLSAGLYFRF